MIDINPGFVNIKVGQTPAPFRGQARYSGSPLDIGVKGGMINTLGAALGSIDGCHLSPQSCNDSSSLNSSKPDIIIATSCNAWNHR